MRKVLAMVLMALGIIVLVAATAVLVRNRLSLPPWSVQTEGRWTAYGMHKWAFVVWELPLGLAVLMAGYLLWPSRLTGLAAMGLGAVALIIALAGLVAYAGLTYGALCNVLEPSPTPPMVLEALSFLLRAVVSLAPLLVMTVLAGGVAWRSLQRKEETKWKELQS